MIEVFRTSDFETKRRLLRYFELLEICRDINKENDSKNIKRNVSVHNCEVTCFLLVKKVK